jgi:hypothetical protein
MLRRLRHLGSNHSYEICLVKGAGGVPRSDAKKGANTGPLTGELKVPSEHPLSLF